MSSASLKKEKKIGIFISYMYIAINAVMNVVLVPYLISGLGSAEYGVYKIIHSFANYLLIMDFGVGTVVVRNVSLHLKNQEQEKIDKCLSVCFVCSFVMATIIFVAGLILNGQIDYIYSNSLTSDQISLAKTLFIIMVLNIVVSLFVHFFNGYIEAHEKFVFVNTCSLLRIIFRFLIIIVLIFFIKSAIIVALVDLLLTIVLLIVDLLYSTFALKIRIHIKSFDKSLLKGYLVFSSAIFLQSVVNQINNSVDNVILGVMMSPEVVTMYSSGLTIYGLYCLFPDVVQKVFLPEATRLFAEKIPNDNGEFLTKYVSRIGRYTSMMCFAILGGFIAVGRDFIQLWIGSENIDAWFVALVLMIPVTIPICENLMITILNATNRRMFRSIVLVLMAFFNIVATIILVPKIGYLGAAIATAASLIIGHGIVLNIYYKKIYNLRILDLFKTTYGRVLPCCIVAIVLTHLFSILVNNVSWFSFIFKMCFFLLIYILMIFFFCLCKSEKESLLGVIKKRKRSE